MTTSPDAPTPIQPPPPAGPVEPAGPAGPAGPAALVEPVVPVRGRWITLLVLANLAVFMGFFTPIQELLPEQVKAIDPGHKEAMLGWVTGLGALAAVVANPLAGALSDRTTARRRRSRPGRRRFLSGRGFLSGRRFLRGRRHPWTLGGALAGAAALVLLANQHTIVGVALAWVAAQVCFNAMLASLTAAVPDRVPVAQRGAVSGWVGIPQVFGLVLGVALVTVLVSGVWRGYLVLAVAVVLLAVPFPLATPDDELPAEHRPPLRLRRFWVSPRRYPDFAWMFTTRFLVFLGNALGTLYLLYFLTDRVRYRDPQTGLLILILIYTAALTATAVVAGRRSDRTGRRKRYVIASGVVMTTAALLLAFAPRWPVAMLAAAVLGAGFGVYLAVDNAMVTQVLPEVADRAKDLGVVNIAASAPQVLAPAIAAPIVRSLGGYPALYLLTAAVTLVGGVLVYRVRSVL
jgi:MFS family permease